MACARHLQGRALIQQGQIPAGLALLDEAMVAVIVGELSPIVTGLIYCSVIEACQQAYALSRAREWTFAMARWCEQQPEMVVFTGTCLVRRAEILQVHGSMVGRDGRGMSRLRTFRASQAETAWRGVLSAGRDPPVAREFSSGRGGVRSRKSSWDMNPSPDSLCSGWLKDEQTQHVRRFAAS